MSRSLKTKQSFDETNVQGFYKEAKTFAKSIR